MASNPAILEPTVQPPLSLSERPDDQGNSAFFYGTLMHPSILRRVIANDGNHLKICSAILFSHVRLHVQHCDYPAVVSYDVGQKVMGEKAISDDEKTVRGVVVRGLTAQDIALLDVFEGDEYRRESISAVSISPWSSLNDAKTNDVLSKSLALPDPTSTPKISALVYIWEASIERLAPQIWSYDVFVREKIGRWLENDPTDEEQRQDEVNRRVSMAGTILAPVGGEGVLKIAEDQSQETSVQETKPTFGHGMLRYFGFAEGYINLNNGSFGATPLPVTKYCDEINILSEARPDLFFRTTYKPMLREVRASVARLIGAETDECVMVPNATHGINTILRNFSWEEGDILVNFSTTYYAIKQSLHYFRDTEPHVTVHDIPLVFPMSHAEILKMFREHMESLPDTYDQKVMVLIDTLASNPGITFPWEEMVKICKEYKAWSLEPLSVAALCCMFHEGINTSYAPLFQRHGATSRRLIKLLLKASSNVDTGTMDLAPYLSVKAALDFRESIGGEQAIQEYCNNLAVQGGKLMAEILGTGTTELTEEFTGPMTNVRLPLPPFGDKTLTASVKDTEDIMTELTHEYNTFVAAFVHGGSWWIRASAQIWNDSHLRLRVRHCDYPAVVSCDVGRKVMGAKATNPEEEGVRGVVVRGLTAQDIALLDVFEGDEYRRQPISVVTISPWSSLNDAETNDVLSKSLALPDPTSTPKISALVYIWEASIKRLSPQIWSYDVFVREKIGRWLENNPTDEEQRQDEVNRRVSMAGTILAPVGGEGVLKIAENRSQETSFQATKPTFGHGMLRYFGFAKGYINLNNGESLPIHDLFWIWSITKGSFGSPPLLVTMYCDEINKLAEARPDLFLRAAYKPLLREVRVNVARLVGADAEECVMVPNVTHGINTILRNFAWKKGDIFVNFSTTYYSIRQTLHYFRDIEPDVTIHDIPLVFPMTHAEILKTFREHMESLPEACNQKVMVIIDTIASAPGVRFPWEEMVKTNVRLPLPTMEQETLAGVVEDSEEIMSELMHGYNAFVAVFVHGGSWWIRASAQIWNELSDFEYVAKALKAICARRSKRQASRM
ncbi:hypothetical protein FRB97_001315 [Tulasnella sp. 331]|nr:hypothetical protein FRB97_001315 [Tulasnella sp. 331]